MFGIKGLSIAFVALFSVHSYAELITPSVDGCLRVRSKARKGKIKKCVPAGQSMKVLSQRGNWVQVDYGSGRGWTYRPMTKSYSAGTSAVSPSSSNSYVTPDVGTCLNLRRSSSRSSGVMQCVKPGEKMQVLGRSGKRLKVKVGDKTGYVYGGLTKKHSGEQPETSPVAEQPAASNPPQAVSGGGTPTSGKRKVDTFVSNACEKIKQNKNKMSRGRVSRATQYYTPIFNNLSSTHPVKYKGRYRSNNYWCKNVEGSCRVGNKLYNYGKKGYTNLDNTSCKFGFGSGKNSYNKTNCLDPCRTVATYSLPKGSVVYFPSMDGKICPQTGKPIDGCFVVSDVGDAIRGRGRFDLFAGECKNFRGGVCQDKYMSNFVAPSGSTYYVMGRHNKLAKEMREESDMVIRQGWRSTFAPVADAFEQVVSGFQ